MFSYVRNERCGRDEWEKNDCVKASQSVTSPLSGGKKGSEIWVLGG